MTDARGIRGRVGEWRDLLAATDPGLNRLFSALQMMVGIAVSIGVVYAFMHVTNVMWSKAPPGSSPAPAELALLAAQHRGVTLLMMVLGGLTAMLTALAVVDPTPREQAKTMALMPVPLLLTMAVAIELASHRTLGIALLAVVIGAGTYLRRFVPRLGSCVFLYGIELFAGYIFGFLGGGAIAERQLGWIAVVLWLAALVNFLLKAIVTRPLDRGRLGRTSRAFRARCRAVVAAATALFDATDARERERAGRLLHRRLTRLNETALVIDASIATAADPPLGAAAPDAHDELFELELIVQNVGRLAERLAAAELPPRLRAELRGWLDDLRAGNAARAADAARAFERSDVGASLAGVDAEDAARIHRLANLIVHGADAVARWPRHHRRLEDDLEARFTSPVTLIFGELPGSAIVSARAATPGTDRRGALLRRLRLDPPAQSAIRIMLAVGGAAALGSILSEPRFYWAVIAVFIAFMGANTAAEQVAKAVNRVFGTVAGILIGSLLAHAVGRSSWAIAVMIVALGFGVYFMRVSYALMVVGLTVAISQLYEQLGVYSDHLLVLRLEETAIGAAVAMVAALVIFPIRTRSATRVAAADYLSALENLLAGVSARLRKQDREPRLTGASRALDHATHQLLATTRPLRSTPFRRDRLEHNVGLVSQTAHEARNLVAQVERDDTLDQAVAEAVLDALDAEREAVVALGRALERGVAPVPARRVDDDLRATLDRSLAGARVPGDDHERGLLRQVDRLDETIAELHTNMTGAR